MEPRFWHERWETNEIGFHQDDVNPLLLKHWGDLNAASGGRVFVPLCGKSRDLTWLAGQGHEAVGVELSEIAAQAFFTEQGLRAQRREAGDFIAYEADCGAGRVRILCGDFFALTAAHLGEITAVFDRAALIAMPPAMRPSYAGQLKALLPAGAPILLITLGYEEGQVNPPPFRVPQEEIEALYRPWREVECLGEQETTVKDITCPEFAYRLQASATSS